MFWTLAGLFILTRAQIFYHLNMNYIDTDQPVMWLGAMDYSAGHFYEPRYYGQNYNTFMEGLFAVPLIWLKIPVYYAVPAATHFIFVFPFLFTAACLFYSNRKIHAILVLSLVICLPVSYDILNGISRGFITGIFFTSFFILSILNPSKLSFILLNTIMAIVGYFVNPNSVLVSGPVLFYIFLYNYKNAKYYLLNLVCLAAALLLHLFFNKLYIDHPDYIVLGLPIEISFKYFSDNILHLNERFAHISPLVENNCIILMTILALLFISLFRQNRNGFYALLVFAGILLFSFSVGKTLEGSTWPFISYGRMYLGIPVIICLFIPFLNFDNLKKIAIVSIIPLSFFIYKTAVIKQVVEWQTKPEQFRSLPVFTLKSSLDAISYYKDVCMKNDSKFILVSTGFWLHTVVTYGGPAIHKDYPATQETDSDRRYWIKEKSKNLVEERFIFISSLPDFNKRVPQKDFALQDLDGYGMFLVTGNRLKMSEFISLVVRTETLD
jgi:hypothetical protein